MEVNIPKLKVYADTPMGRAIRRMNDIPGYFSDEEGYELYLSALLGLAVAPAIAEIGSFHGRSTSVLAAACRDCESGKVYAIDPHEGSLYKDARPTEPSLRFFLENMRRAELTDWVFPIIGTAKQAKIKEPVGLLFIDGLHDYESVASDIRIGSKWVASGGYVCFHDYCPKDPGVVQSVDEWTSGSGARFVSQADRLRVMQKV